MKVYAVDDEPISLRLTEQIVKHELPDCEFTAFNFAEDYLEALKKEPCDIAFMDVEMPGMTGIELARESAKFAPKVNMIFLTGYPNYTGQAMDLFASGYVLKPLTTPKLREQLDHLRYPPNEGVTHKLIRVRCFGFFEAFVGTVPITFGREKTRELLAYFVLQRGIPVDAVQIRRALWGLDGLDPKSNSYFHHLKKDLTQSLEAVGAGELLRVSWNNYAIDTARVECDWYAEIEKNPKSSKALVGPFMKQYPWARNSLLKP